MIGGDGRECLDNICVNHILYAVNKLSSIFTVSIRREYSIESGCRELVKILGQAW